MTTFSQIVNVLDQKPTGDLVLLMLALSFGVVFAVLIFNYLVGVLMRRPKVVLKEAKPIQMRTVVEEKQDEEQDTTDPAIIKVLDDFEIQLEENTTNHLGYPYNLENMNHTFKQLSRFSRYTINNLGDPFIESNYRINSRWFEREVLNWFADLYQIGHDEYWGYVTACGTEGNLHAILVGREVYPNGRVYASADSHYSVFKAARFYRMEATMVDSLETGCMDYDAFEQEIQQHPDEPAIVVCNIGTTMKGALDDVDRVIEILERNGMEEFYIHCDGALSGIIVPLLESDSVGISFNKRIDSVAVSGHKFMGVSQPCGILLTRKQHIKKVERMVEYIGTTDTTLMGSRNGHSSIALWYTIQRQGISGFKSDVQKCLANAAYLHHLFQSEGMFSLLNQWSTTVVFEKVNSVQFNEKYQLASAKGLSHVVVMPNVDQEFINAFFKEYMAARQAEGIELEKEHVISSNVREEGVSLRKRKGLLATY